MSFNTRTSDIVDINNDDDSKQSNLVIFIYGTCIIVAILSSFHIYVLIYGYNYNRQDRNNFCYVNRLILNYYDSLIAPSVSRERLATDRENLRISRIRNIVTNVEVNNIDEELSSITDENLDNNDNISHDHISHDTCSICLTDLSDNVGKLSCGHKFHKICIYKWLINENKNTCPICRLDVVNENVYSYESSV